METAKTNYARLAANVLTSADTRCCDFKSNLNVCAHGYMNAPLLSLVTPPLPSPCPSLG